MALNSIAYSPGPVPPNTAHLNRYLEEELRRISISIELLALGHIDKSYAAPSRPRDGDIRYADGTTWNPGSGAGLYYYKSGTWTFIA